MGAILAVIQSLGAFINYLITGETGCCVDEPDGKPVEQWNLFDTYVYEKSEETIFERLRRKNILRNTIVDAILLLLLCAIGLALLIFLLLLA